MSRCSVREAALSSSFGLFRVTLLLVRGFHFALVVAFIGIALLILGCLYI